MKVTFGPVLKKTKIDKLLETLEHLGIKCSNIYIDENEYIDKYDILLSPGVKVSKVNRALIDIGLAMRAQATPIGYPIMKDGVYRIEILKKELESRVFSDLYKKRDDLYAPITLGIDSNGHKFVVDLQTLPNLLVGGIPGSGKSVLLHSIILSLIGIDAKLFLVDPKMVEFNMYDEISCIETIENTVEGVHQIISDVTEIMDSRFERLSSSKCRNALEYNHNRKVKMSPVVIVIDEWADIVLQDKTIQRSLCVVAQKGRAAGISIVMATQRPSVSVISGLIKANFSGRIAMRVASRIDSRIILDDSGAENITDVAMGLYSDHKTNGLRLFRAPFIEDPSDEFDLVVTPRSKTFWEKMWE
jgi:DNA segregation ATPase FtsK/SpoIIIE, S-DNA-T family